MEVQALPLLCHIEERLKDAHSKDQSGGGLPAQCSATDFPG